MKHLIFSILTLVGLALSGSAIAQNSNNQSLDWAEQDEKTSRQGFYLSFGPQFGQETDLIDEFMYGFNLQLGWGLNEQIIAFGKFQGFAYTDSSDTTFTLYGFLAKVQYYFLQDRHNSPYVNGGIGYGGFEISNSTTSYQSSNGLALELAAGYEFRTGRKFFMAPEVLLSYQANESSLSTIVVGASCQFGWFF